MLLACIVSLGILRETNLHCSTRYAPAIITYCLYIVHRTTTQYSGSLLADGVGSEDWGYSDVDRISWEWKSNYHVTMLVCRYSVGCVAQVYPVLARTTRWDTHLWVYWSETYWRDSISILRSAKTPNFTSMIDIQGWSIIVIILCAYRKFLMITQQWAVESIKYSNMPLLSGQILEFHLIHSPCCDLYVWWGIGYHQAMPLFLYTAGNRIVLLS